MADKALSPEIIKLMDKIAENPNSRLFVPLAEEYLNNDMTDEAVHVLNDGIEKHPTYVAARIMLGKIYLRKNLTFEAKLQFEHVIEINPENILAHKKLAVIYQEEGEPHRAVEAYRQILSVDPSDKESKTLLEALEEEIPSAVISEEPEPISADENTFELEMTSSLATPDAPFSTVEDGIPSGTADAEADRVASLSIESDLDETSIASPEKAEESEDENSFDLEEEWEQDPILQDDIAQIETPPDSSAPILEPLPETDGQETPATNSLAALYIDQGCYQEAADIYKECLERDPTDQQSRDGLERALSLLPEEAAPSADLTMELEGKSPEKDQTEHLQSWLDAIKRNRKRI